MSTVTIVLRDTEDGLVDVETTIHDYDAKSNACGMADRLNGHMAEIAKEIQAPMARPDLMCDLGRLSLVEG